MSDGLRHILVATDGSQTGSRAVSYGIALARRRGSTLLFCYAVDHAAAIAECSTSNGDVDLLFPLIKALDDVAASTLSDAQRQAAEAGVVATTSALDGHPAEAIVDCARDRHVDAIVLGTQGKRGVERLFMGSTADGVLRRADVPVFVVASGATDADFADERILVAVDGSDPSDAAVTVVLDLAQTDKSTVIFCGVAETDELFDKAATYGYDPAPLLDQMRATTAAVVAAEIERARGRAITVRSVIAQGNPAEAILSTAQAERTDLIVIGTHGRRGLRRLFVGSVAERVVRETVVPVLVVRSARSVAGRETVVTTH